MKFKLYEIYIEKYYVIVISRLTETEYRECPRPENTVPMHSVRSM